MKENIFAILEALLFVSGDEGVHIRRAAEVLEMDGESVEIELQSLLKRYEKEERGVQIRRFGERFQMVTSPEVSRFVDAYAHPPQTAILSQAALETATIIAYNQPVTRPEIDEIRGVKSDQALSTLLGRGLITESGRMPGVGRAILYETTPRFLDVFGLSSLAELPPIEEERTNKRPDLFLSGYREQP